MGCLCIRKHYRMVDRNSPDTGYASDGTTVSARVELLCRVVDGSGMARVAANSVKSVVHALGLSPSSLEELYDSAARSWNGRLIWKQQSFATNAINQQLGQQQAGNAQESDSASNSGVVERVVSRARAENILVQGFVARLQKENGQPSRSEQQQEQQTLRMDGRSVVLVRNPLPRVIATQVRRLGVIESCWDLLEKSGS
ncbi:hypothetical protein LPJ56_001829 [Coemansia sp. RSA 2599]|nr:hypothetical protein LPJ56_001829 [Coemansia sp. RSA 2599]